MDQEQSGGISAFRFPQRDIIEFSREMKYLRLSTIVGPFVDVIHTNLLARLRYLRERAASAREMDIGSRDRVAENERPG